MRDPDAIGDGRAIRVRAEEGMQHGWPRQLPGHVYSFEDPSRVKSDGAGFHHLEGQRMSLQQLASSEPQVFGAFQEKCLSIVALLGLLVALDERRNEMRYIFDL